MRVTCLLAVLAGTLITTQVHAQMAGLPVGTDAAPGSTGDMTISGGIVIGDNLNLYGGRFAYNVMDEAKVFGGAGIVDPDRGDAGFGVQGGGQYTLPPIQDVPVDLALRGTLGYASLDQRMMGTKFDVDFWTLTAGGLASFEIDEMFSVYGFLGLAYIRTKVSGGGFSHSDSDIEPALGVGLDVSVATQFSLFAEIMHIDDPWFGFGLRYDLP